jgi:hypothetical protein
LIRYDTTLIQGKAPSALVRREDASMVEDGDAGVSGGDASALLVALLPVVVDIVCDVFHVWTDAAVFLEAPCIQCVSVRILVQVRCFVTQESLAS